MWVTYVTKSDIAGHKSDAISLTQKILLTNFFGTFDSSTVIVEMHRCLPVSAVLLNILHIVSKKLFKVEVEAPTQIHGPQGHEHTT